MPDEPNNNDQRGGKYEDLPLLDLRRHSPEAVAAIRKIEDVALLLLSEANAGHLVAKVEDVGAVVTLPDGDESQVVIRTGQVELAGEALSTDAAANQILVASGQIVITPPITECRYRQMHVTGQLLVPRSGRAAVSAALTTMSGQMNTYADDLPLRQVNGHSSFDAAFLMMIDRPECLVSNGHLKIDDDVTDDLLRAKIGEIVCNGHLSVPKSAAAAARFLCREQNGHLEVRG